jgi:hypothetical protein
VNVAALPNGRKKQPNNPVGADGPSCFFTRDASITESSVPQHNGGVGLLKAAEKLKLQKIKFTPVKVGVKRESGQLGNAVKIKKPKAKTAKKSYRRKSTRKESRLAGERSKNKKAKTATAKTAKIRLPP